MQYQEWANDMASNGYAGVNPANMETSFLYQMCELD